MKNDYSLGLEPRLNLHTNDVSKNLGAKKDSAFVSNCIKSCERPYVFSYVTNELTLSAPIVKHKTSNWKRRLFAFAAVIALGVGTGVGIGNWYKDYIASQTFDYSALLIEDYEIDKLAVINSATELNYSSLSDYGQFGEIAALLHSQGKTPASLSAVQNVALAEYIATTAWSYSAIGVGLIDTLVKQPMSSRKMFDGHNYMVESVSSGAVMGSRLDVANRAITSVDNPDITLLYTLKAGTIPVADENGVFSAQFNTTPTRYSEEEFIEANGSPTNRMLPYIVSDKTVLDGTTDATLSTFDDKPVYEFTLVLDPVGSVLRYYRQMNLTSGYNPKFSAVSVKILLDENWNFVHSEVTEKYTVIAMGVPASCTGTLVTDYTFNEEVILPEVTL